MFKPFSLAVLLTSYMVLHTYYCKYGLKKKKKNWGLNILGGIMNWLLTIVCIFEFELFELFKLFTDFIEVGVSTGLFGIVVVFNVWFVIIVIFMVSLRDVMI